VAGENIPVDIYFVQKDLNNYLKRKQAEEKKSG